MTKKVYTVTDMHCENCKARVTEVLKKAGLGFFSYKVDLASKTVTVSGDKVDVPAVLAAAGYTAVLKGEK